MTMLKSFDLAGNKQSFASWISNLSPCETPFTSMVGKENVDQVQYSWQVDRLATVAHSGEQEGSAVVIAAKPAPTVVKHNYTQILRKVVRISDTTKKIGLYGRESELALQLEKAGMELKRDLEFMMLNNDNAGNPGTSSIAGQFAGFYPLVAGSTVADGDTGAVVNKVVTYAAAAGTVKFTQVQVFDLTYNLYLAGSKANKIMFHPEHMGVFSDWMSNNASITPHVHRMFDGMDTKFNVHVTTIRDPLGQEFTLIPNRHMPRNRLFFFNEADWTQMLLRSPEKVELAKNGSAEKHMIEMEVGLRHRNPYASGILEFNVTGVPFVQSVDAIPGNIEADGTTTSTLSAFVKQGDGSVGTTGNTVTFTAVDEAGTSATLSSAGAVAPTVSDNKAIATVTVKHNKASRIKVKAAVNGGTGDLANGHTVVETYESRDK